MGKYIYQFLPHVKQTSLPQSGHIYLPQDKHIFLPHYGQIYLPHESDLSAKGPFIEIPEKHSSALPR